MEVGYTPGVVAMPKYGQIPNYIDWCIQTTWRYFRHAVREVGGELNQPGIRIFQACSEGGGRRAQTTRYKDISSMQ